MKQDYADWLTPERLEVEEILWRQSRLYAKYAAAIRRMIEAFPAIRTVTEFGAGTGWIPAALSDLPIDLYTLVDRNPGCLAIARERHISRNWVHIEDQEIRELFPSADLVCGFAVLKHFPLEGWEDLFARLFGSTNYGLFTVATSYQCVEDQSEEFTHTRISEEFLASTIAKIGRKEIWRDSSDPEEPIIAMRKV